MWIVIVCFFLMGTCSHAQVTYYEHKSITQDGVFYINYPSTWSQVENAATIFTFAENDNHGFRSNINLTISNSTNNLKQDVEESIKALKQFLKNYKLEETEQVVINNMHYGRMIYTHTMNNQVVRVILYQIIYKGKLYNITCSTSIEEYNNLIDTFNIIVKSFKIGHR